MTSEVRVCSACGSPATPTAKYCSECGRQFLGDEDVRRVYGALMPGPAVVLGCVLLAAAVVALIAVSPIVAIVLLALAVAAFVLFYDAARRHPESSVAQRVSRTGHNVRGWARFVAESSSAWTAAMRSTWRLKGESRALQREREQVLRSLGDAAYREEEPLVTTLRQRLREIDDGLAERDRERAETLAKARHHVEEEHAAARPTQQYSVDELTTGKDGDDK